MLIPQCGIQAVQKTKENKYSFTQIFYLSALPMVS